MMTLKTVSTKFLANEPYRMGIYCYGATDYGYDGTETFAYVKQQPFGTGRKHFRAGIAVLADEVRDCPKHVATDTSTQVRG